MKSDRENVMQKRTMLQVKVGGIPSTWLIDLLGLDRAKPVNLRGTRQAKLPIKDWHVYFGNSKAADSLCDRFVRNCHRVELLADAESNLPETTKA